MVFAWDTGTAYRRVERVGPDVRPKASLVALRSATQRLHGGFRELGRKGDTVLQTKPQYLRLRVPSSRENPSHHQIDSDMTKTRQHVLRDCLSRTTASTACPCLFLVA